MQLTEQQTRDFLAGADPDQYMSTFDWGELFGSDICKAIDMSEEYTSMQVFSPLSDRGITVSQAPRGGWYFGGNHKVYKTLRGLRNAIKKFNRW